MIKRNARAQDPIVTLSQNGYGDYYERVVGMIRKTFWDGELKRIDQICVPSCEITNVRHAWWHGFLGASEGESEFRCDVRLWAS